MSQNLIDLSSDNDENQNDDVDFPPTKIKKTSTATMVTNSMLHSSNAKTFECLKEFRNFSTSPMLPTIVSVQSMAKPQCLLLKQPAVTTATPQNKMVKKMKLPSILKNRRFSTEKSITESIESCISQHVVEPPVIDIDDTPQLVSIVVNKKNKAVELDEVHSLEIPEELGVLKTSTSVQTTVSAVKLSKLETNKPATSKDTCSMKADISEMNISTNTLLFREFLCKSGSLEEVTEDRQRAIEKLRGYHEKADINYIESKAFTNLLRQKLKELDKKNLYLCMKEVLDELKLNKAVRRIGVLPAPSSTAVMDAFRLNQLPEDESFADLCKHDTVLSISDEKLVNKLRSTLEKLSRKIKKLEEVEVDFDDEDESVYLRMQRYRERFSKIYSKLSKYTGAPLHAGRVTKNKIHFNGTKYPEVNKLIQRWLNKIGTFPDFTDVLRVIKTLDLGIRPDSLRAVAAEAFREIGNLLQKRRRMDLWDSLEMYAYEDDPAKDDPTLQATLEENDVIYSKKEQEIIDKFVQKQMEMNLEPNVANNAESCSENEKENSDDDVDDDDIDSESNDSSSITTVSSDKEADKDTISKKETKNNYINCKSAWSREDGSKRSSINIRRVVSEQTDSANLADSKMDYLVVDCEDNGKTQEDKTLEVQLLPITTDVLKLRDKVKAVGNEKRISTKNTDTPVHISSKEDENVSQRQENRQLNRSFLSTKPFGTAGKVVEINYFNVENVSKNCLVKHKLHINPHASVLKDSLNIRTQRYIPRLKSLKMPPKGLSPELKATIADVQWHGPRDLVPNLFFSGQQSAPHKIKDIRCIYKTHGTVVNGGSPNDTNYSGSKEDNQPAPERESDRGSPASQGTGGGSGNGDQDEKDDQNKNKGDKEVEDNDDESEEAEGECEKDKSENNTDSGPCVDNSEECSEALNIVNYKTVPEGNINDEEDCDKKCTGKENGQDNGEIYENEDEDEDEAYNNTTLVIDTDSSKAELFEPDNDAEDANGTTQEGRGTKNVEKQDCDEAGSPEDDKTEEGETEWGNETDDESDVLKTEDTSQSADDDDPLKNIELDTHSGSPSQDSNSKVSEKADDKEESKNTHTGSLSQDSNSKVSEKADDKVESENRDNFDKEENINSREEQSSKNLVESQAPSLDLSPEIDKVSSKNKLPQKLPWIDNGEDSDKSNGDSNGPEVKSSDEPGTQKSDSKPKIEVSKELSEDKNNEKKESDFLVNQKLASKRKNTIPISNELPKKMKKIIPEVASNDIEVISESIVKKRPPVSPDERVKRFLQNADSSLSITVTRKKPMSVETKQAIEQLRKLKNISATRVAGTNPDVMVVEEKQLAGPSRSPSVMQRSPRLTVPQLNSRLRTNAPNIITPRLPSIRPAMRGWQNPRGLPFISSVQSYNSRTPVITGVRGWEPALMRRGASPACSRTPLRASFSPSGPTIRGRGRGTTRSRVGSRGRTRGAVPFVVLD